MIDFLSSAAALTFAMLLVAATFLLYFFKHLTESFERRRVANARSERLVGALYAEIQANVEGLRDFLDHAPPVARVADNVRNEASQAPHFGGVAHSLVYESNLGDLVSLPHAAVLKAVGFYSQLERVSGSLDTLDSGRFGELSPEQRAQAVTELWRNVERAEKLGREALHALEVNIPLGVMRKALAQA